MLPLNELDLAHDIIPVDLHAGGQLTPEFLALNPAAKLPVLVDGDMVISESAAIQLYLADKYGDRFPGGGLIPDTPEERGRMYHWLFFLMTEIEAPLRSEAHTSELQSLMRISYAVFCLKYKISYGPENTTLTRERHKL